MSDRKKRVAVLVDDKCEHDGRVIKGAEFLASRGFDIMVFAQGSAGNAGLSRVNGVTYRRFVKRKRREPSALVPGSLFHESHQQTLRQRLTGALEDASVLLSFARLLWRIKRGGLGKPPGEQRIGSIASLVEEHTSRREQADRETKRATKPPSKPGRSPAESKFESVLDRYGAAVRAFRPSLIHSHDPACLAAAVALGDVVGCPFIHDVHDAEAERNAAPADPKAAEIRRAKAVITVSEELAARLTERYGVHPLVVYDTPRSVAVDPAWRNVRDDLALGVDTPLAVHIGSIVTDRGIERFVRAMPSVPTLHFALVGVENGKMQTQVQSWARDIGIAERVHLLPPVRFDAVPSYISSASFGVIPWPAGSEDQPVAASRTLFEMIFAALPILVADGPQWRSLLERFGEGILYPSDASADLRPFIEQMIAKCANGAWRASCREKALAASRSIGWEQQMPVVEALYAELLAAAPAPSL